MCVNDIMGLWSARGLDRDVFPYVQGGFRDGRLVGGSIEYPVLTGSTMWVAAALTDSRSAYFVLHVVFLGAAALLTTWLLFVLVGPRSILFAAAPAIALYAFHNWDVLPVLFTVVGVSLWARGSPAGAAVAFGIGGAFKLFPLVFLMALGMDEHRRAGPRRGIASVAAGLGTFVAINLPFALADLDGWMATYRFHAQRIANYDSVWQLGAWAPFQPGELNALTTVMTGIFLLGAVIYGSFREQPFLPVAAASLAALLLWGKVQSPQFLLWLLPFLALLRIRAGWWAALAVADLAAFLGVTAWFFRFFVMNQEALGLRVVFVSGVWLRTVLIALLYFLFLRAQPVVARPVTPPR